MYLDKIMMLKNFTSAEYKAELLDRKLEGHSYSLADTFHDKITSRNIS